MVRFLTISESITNQYYDRADPNNFINTYLFNYISFKLFDNADNLVNIQGATYNSIQQNNGQSATLRQSPASYYVRCPMYIVIFNIKACFSNLNFN